MIRAPREGFFYGELQTAREAGQDRGAAAPREPALQDPDQDAVPPSEGSLGQRRRRADRERPPAPADAARPCSRSQRDPSQRRRAQEGAGSADGRGREAARLAFLIAFKAPSALPMVTACAHSWES